MICDKCGYNNEEIVVKNIVQNGSNVSIKLNNNGVKSLVHAEICKEGRQYLWSGTFLE